MGLLSKEELRKIAQGKSDIDARAEYEKAIREASSPEPDQPENEPAQPVVEEPNSGDVAPQEAAKEPTETEEQEDSSTESTDESGNSDLAQKLSLLERQMKLQELKAQKQEQDAKKWQTLAQQRAGELDYMKKNPSRDQSDTATPDYGSLFEDADPGSKSGRGNSSLSSEQAEFMAERVQSAKEAAEAKFLKEFSDFDVSDDEFIKLVQSKATDYADELQSGAPKKVGKAIDLILRESRVELLIQKEEKALAEAQERKAAVEERVREEKLNVSTSKTESGTKPTQSERSLEDIPIEELRKMVNQQARGARSGR